MTTGTAGRWDPGQYDKFSDHRRRPAVELLARVPPADDIGLAGHPGIADDPGLAVDLGCGSGEITRLLAERWPGAAVQGIDNSPDMLARARAGEAGGAGPGIEWIEADIAAWTPRRRGGGRWTGD